MNKVFKNIHWVLFLAVLLLGVPRLAGVVAGLLNYQAIDPDGAYAWLSVHHIVQALIFLIIIFLLNRVKPLDYGFGWGNKKVGKEYVLRFALFFGIYTAGSFFTVILSRSFQFFPYPLTATNIIGQLGFQLLLTGPSEELIFRAFALTMLALFIQGRVLKGKVSAANLIAAIIFGLAHVGFSFSPFELRYSPVQVLYAIGLGLFYGDCYEKSGSMYYPMIMHSYTNVLMVGVQVIVSFLI